MQVYVFPNITFCIVSVSRQQNQAEDQEQYVAAMTAGSHQPATMPQGAYPRGAPLGQPGALPFNATMVPLQVRLPHKAPRPPTLSECEVIIRHLQQLNDKQAHEVGVILLLCVCLDIFSSSLLIKVRDHMHASKWGKILRGA